MCTDVFKLCVKTIPPAGLSTQCKAGGSRLLGRIDTALITFVHPHVPDDIAEWLGCPALEVGVV
jgi:hypothetical protein